MDYPKLPNRIKVTLDEHMMTNKDLLALHPYIKTMTSIKNYIGYMSIPKFVKTARNGCLMT